ncbi:hypothetical protein PF006_g27401 [Phytophthora fragariae]|uniref:Uncharacterized protein n=1 Tax=Phytophthora fragariae TaxID=53985 RepID=A0A6A3QNP0_9STRA|nr:hypothetical protein PF003_g25395 [Phytophthora fragariae]KAE9079996.1 hypothetical protein PF006_g27401 [Phytophthora fragariae]
MALSDYSDPKNAASARAWAAAAADEVVAGDVCAAALS